MDVRSLDIQNFLTIGKATIELDNRGLLLIQGVNKDDPSAESNGAGKSSIVDALCWAIYGVTARDVTGDAVVNKKAKKDCRVCVTLEDGSMSYVIIRYRKDSVGKNQVIVNQMPLGTSVGTDLSKGTDKETQEVINQIMGCSLEVFMASIYAGQEKMPDLPGMTDKFLKSLIEEAAGVEVLTAAYAIARERASTAKIGHELMTKALVALKSELAESTHLIGTLEGDAVLFEDERKVKAKAELVKAMPLKVELKALNDEVAATPVAPLLAEIRRLEEQLTLESAQKITQAELAKKDRATQNEALIFKSQYENAKRAVEVAEKALVDIDEQVGKLCGECGKVYEETDLRTACLAIQDSIEAAKANQRTVGVALKDALVAAKATSDASTAFEATLTDFTEVAKRLRVVSDEVSAVRRLEASVTKKEKEIEAVNVLAKVKLTETNPWTKAIEVEQVRIGKFKTDVEASTEEVKTLTDNLLLLEDAVRVYGPAGVRAHILDTVTPFLNDRTREYLGALSDGNIHAVWTTLAKTAKGDLREKFNIDVSNDMGSETFAGLSGGEKRKVRLACAMALQDMVASRATKPIGLFIADEVDHALDEAGLERLMGVLERKARERGTVLVISHNSLSDWCSNVITVTKEGGIATVDGCARGF